jgi:hypothetical protein
LGIAAFVAEDAGYQESTNANDNDIDDDFDDDNKEKGWWASGYHATAWARRLGDWLGESARGEEFDAGIAPLRLG